MLINFTNYVRGIDQSIFRFFHNLAGNSKAGDFIIVFFGEYLVYLVVIVFGYFLYKNGKSVIKNVYPYVTAIIAAIIARFGVIVLFRYFYHRPRPFLALSLEHLLINDSYSFPSGHTIFLFALGTATYFFNKKLAYFIFVSGLLVGLGRIAGGVHYPSDILGGILLGALIGFITYKIYYYFIQRFKVL
ncbi:MAG: phosphatase PAP2 family protein [Patescibacteria group bacterium]